MRIFLLFFLQTLFIFSCTSVKVDQELIQETPNSQHYIDMHKPDAIMSIVHENTQNSPKARYSPSNDSKNQDNYSPESAVRIVHENILNVSHIKPNDKEPAQQRLVITTKTNHVKVPVKTPVQVAYDTSSRYAVFPQDDNEHVARWIRFFSGRGAKHMKKHLERSTRYMPVMKSILKQKDLPLDLVYMVLIESGFSATATSSASAVGFWQFINSTGTEYGLNINNKVDDRRDFILSTQAASYFLTDLYRKFGDWKLSMAAYNAGPGRISRAIKRHGSNDFWDLVKKQAIPKETINYVPKIIAARIIAQQPEKYNFTNLTYQKPLSYRLLTISESVLMSDISSHLGVSLGSLRRLNPKFKTDTISVKNKHVYFRVPASI